MMPLRCAAAIIRCFRERLLRDIAIAIRLPLLFHTHAAFFSFCRRFSSLPPRRASYRFAAALPLSHGYCRHFRRLFTLPFSDIFANTPAAAFTPFSCHFLSDFTPPPLYFHARLIRRCFAAFIHFAVSRLSSLFSRWCAAIALYSFFFHATPLHYELACCCAYRRADAALICFIVFHYFFRDIDADAAIWAAEPPRHASHALFYATDFHWYLLITSHYAISPRHFITYIWSLRFTSHDYH